MSGGAHNKSDKGMGTIIHPPGFAELANSEYQAGNSPFVKLRNLAYDEGFELSRIKARGYVLEGHDLPTAGVVCRTLDEVKEELLNYGIELEDE